MWREAPWQTRFRLKVQEYTLGLGVITCSYGVTHRLDVCTARKGIAHGSEHYTTVGKDLALQRRQGGTCTFLLTFHGEPIVCKGWTVDPYIFSKVKLLFRHIHSYDTYDLYLISCFRHDLLIHTYNLDIVTELLSRSPKVQDVIVRTFLRHFLLFKSSLIGNMATGIGTRSEAGNKQIFVLQRHRQSSCRIFMPYETYL